MQTRLKGHELMCLGIVLNVFIFINFTYRNFLTYFYYHPIYVVRLIVKKGRLRTAKLMTTMKEKSMTAADPRISPTKFQNEKIPTMVTPIMKIMAGMGEISSFTL